MGLAASFVFAVLVLICVLDFVCIVKHWPSLGYRVQQWSRTNLVFVGAWLFVLALLLTHVFGNCIHYDGTCTVNLPAPPPAPSH
jgi:hypothetical protein